MVMIMVIVVVVTTVVVVTVVVTHWRESFVSVPLSSIETYLPDSFYTKHVLLQVYVCVYVWVLLL